MDLTGKFPLRSADRYTAMFILYDWTSNAILVSPIKYEKDDTMFETLKKVEYLSARGFKPEYNVMDNVASKSIWTYLKKENIKLQLVKPHSHRVNASKHAIQTFKNHFISGLCISNKALPTILWRYLVNQCQDSLNMIQTSHVYPKLSAHPVLEVTHNFNCHPWAPPETRGIIFNTPETRGSWDTRALDEWYIGP